MPVQRVVRTGAVYRIGDADAQDDSDVDPVTTASHRAGAPGERRQTVSISGAKAEAPSVPCFSPLLLAEFQPPSW